MDWIWYIAGGLLVWGVIWSIRLGRDIFPRGRRGGRAGKRKGRISRGPRKSGRKGGVGM